MFVCVCACVGFDLYSVAIRHTPICFLPASFAIFIGGLSHSGQFLFLLERNPRAWINSKLFGGDKPGRILEGFQKLLDYCIVSHDLCTGKHEMQRQGSSPIAGVCMLDGMTFVDIQSLWRDPALRGLLAKAPEPVFAWS